MPSPTIISAGCGDNPVHSVRIVTALDNNRKRDAGWNGAVVVELKAPYRRATPEDATHMAELVNIAGDGLPLYLWARFARAGQSAWDVGLERARTGTGGFAYRNTVVREEAGKVAACLIGYPLGDKPEPVDDSVPALLVPLLKLEHLVPGTWYINVLASIAEFRSRGVGSALMAKADELAAKSGARGLSLIVEDTNLKARKLYERLGFSEVARRPFQPFPGSYPVENWILMERGLQQPES